MHYCRVVLFGCLGYLVCSIFVSDVDIVVFFFPWVGLGGEGRKHVFTE